MVFIYLQDVFNDSSKYLMTDWLFYNKFDHIRLHVVNEPATKCPNRYQVLSVSVNLIHCLPHVMQQG